MATLDRYPSKLLLTVLFGAALIAHTIIISSLQPFEPHAFSRRPPKRLTMSLTNTWRPAVHKPVHKLISRPTPIAEPAPHPQKTAPISHKVPTVKPETEIQPAEPILKTVKPTPQPASEPAPKPAISHASLPVDISKPAVRQPEPVAAGPAVHDRRQPLKNRADNSKEKTAAISAKAEKSEPRQQIDWNLLVNRFISSIDIQEYYPSAARRRRQQGTVLLQVALSDGIKVASVSVAHSSRHASLDNAAVDLIRANRQDLEKILEAGGVRLLKPTILRLPIHFRLR